MLSSVMVFATFCHSTTIEAAELNPEHGFEQVNVEEFLTMNYESQGYVQVTDPAILMQ